MNVGSLGIIGSAAGTPLSQAKGSDADKAAQDTASQSRSTKSNDKAELAEGVGQTEQDEQTSDRDADGRRIWERGPDDPGTSDEDDSGESASSAGPQSKDPTGQSGSQLDLSG